MKIKSNIDKLAFIFCLFLCSNTLVVFAEVDLYTPLENIEANSSWFWSNYVVLSNTSTSSSYYPQIAFDSNDNIHIVWFDDTPDLLSSGPDTDIFYISYNSATKTWSSLELVSSESTSSSTAPVMVVDADGNIHVAWTDYTDYLGSGPDRDVFYKKKNAGGSWTTTSVVSTESTSSVYEMVSITVDNNENIYIAWTDPTDILGAGIDYDIFMKYFNSTSTSWSSLTLISTESTSSAYRPQIVVNSLSGDIHFVWYDYTDILGADTDGDIFYRRWNVFSSSLSDLRLINSFSTLNSYHPKLDLDNEGNLHVIWSDYTNYLGSGINLDLYYRQLYSSSDTWSQIELVSTESQASTEHPDLIVDKNGCVFIAWYDQTDYNGAGTDYDIFFKYRDPILNQWSLTEVLSIESNDISQLPQLAFDSHGFISCVWSDDADLAGSGVDADIIYRKFAGFPSIPMLSPIIPNPSSIGNVSLSWSEILSAKEYAIYRDTSYIWTISGMSPIATTIDVSFTDELNETGIFYYAIQAINEYGYSAISNIEYVEITEDTKTGLFASLSLTEILILAGSVLVLQIIFSAITYSLVKRNVQTKSKPSKSKK